MTLTVEYICDNCSSRVKHTHQSKPAILPRKEHGWAWIHTDEGQELWCGDCLDEHTGEPLSLERGGQLKEVAISHRPNPGIDPAQFADEHDPKKQ